MYFMKLQDELRVSNYKSRRLKGMKEKKRIFVEILEKKIRDIL